MSKGMSTMTQTFRELLQNSWLAFPKMFYMLICSDTPLPQGLLDPERLWNGFLVKTGRWAHLHDFFPSFRLNDCGELEEGGGGDGERDNFRGKVEVVTLIDW